MPRTVICHFYNEECLLPWWLMHHKHVFDHGIMIDYHSTDRSMEIIRDICPDWEIRYTRNRYFDPIPIDEEVMDIEQHLSGWRMCLNVTEFLYGNYDRLVDTEEPAQYFVSNYVFVDMQDPTRGQTLLDHRYPLHMQRYWGYDELANNGAGKATATMARMNRSLHNYPIKYPVGRHFGDGKPGTWNDLAIFYYGWADSSPAGVQRKLQIKDKISSHREFGPHHLDKEMILKNISQLADISRDLREEIEPLLEHNRRITQQEF